MLKIMIQALVEHRLAHARQTLQAADTLINRELYRDTQNGNYFSETPIAGVRLPFSSR